MTSPLVLSSPKYDGIIADGDPTVERAVVDPIGRLGRVALPPVCDTVVGLDVMPPTALALSESSYSITTNKNRPQGAFRGRYDFTGGEAWCAPLCVTLFDSTSGLVLYSDPTHSESYRIDHGTDVPMGLTLLAEDARLCAALCGILVLINSSEEAPQ